MENNELSGEEYPPPNPPVSRPYEEVVLSANILPQVLGTKNNPIIYKKHTFINAKITITQNIHVKFIECIFIKCQLNGTYTMKDCESKDHDEKVYKTIPSFKIEPCHEGYLNILGNITPPKKNKYINYIKKYLA